MINKKNEEIYIICLSPKNQVVKCEKLAVGTTREAQVAMRVISDVMFRNKVTDIILGHNHPSGKTQPSMEDNDFTKAVVTALSFNGFRLLDHIIIGDGDYFSYRQARLLDEYEDAFKSLMSVKTVGQPHVKYEVDND